MSTYVARTCTEVGTSDRFSAHADGSRPLSDFRQHHAYVLLGNPGSGKTTEFDRERVALGDAAIHEKARDFIKLDLDSHPEWRNKTLFIDGLDEVRAGATDQRAPLDEIRLRLEQLGVPKFRLSCREADWLGANDRQSLERICPDSNVTVLRLNPLDDEAAAKLLSSQDMRRDARQFIDEARGRGLSGLLGNPQTLLLLADAVDHGESWPTSRAETFEAACRKMAAEQNQEHLAAADALPPLTSMDAAGYLCAMHLLADVEGYLPTRRPDAGALVCIDDLEQLPGAPNRHCMKQALATSLFTGSQETGFTPVHRHIAEFLGGRYLAKLIADGLPASRVIALMASPSDGRVTTELRGLSAWLSVYSSEARLQLIDVDPVGVGLYGDIGDFSPSEKEHLLKSLARFAAQGPLLGFQQHDARQDGFRNSTAEAFRPLASADMALAIKRLLTELGTESQDHRFLELICEVLSGADQSSLEALVLLLPELEASVRDPARPPFARRLALDAYLRIAPLGDSKTHTLTQLLNEIHNRDLPDPDDDLCGTLLEYLYPIWLSPSQVWRYVQPRHRHNYTGRFVLFWRFGLLEQSSDEHIAGLLDSLSQNQSAQLAALEQSRLEDLPYPLLHRGLEAWGDTLDHSRLYDWLNTPGRSRSSRTFGREAAQRIKEWLEARPHVQKSVFLNWIRRYETSEELEIYGYWNCNALHWSQPPADFGLWCLDKAVEVANAETFVAQELLRQASRSLDEPSISKGLTPEIMTNRTIGHNALAGQLDLLRNPPPPPAEVSEWEREMADQLAKYEQEKRQRQKKWAAALQPYITELQENRAPPPILDSLAKVYFALFIDVDEQALPESRISDFIGGDTHLVDAAISALRRAVLRDDLPQPEETIALQHESCHSWLAFPVLASLELLHKEETALLDLVDDKQRRNALAIRYCVADSAMQSATSPCHDRWLEEDPDLVLEVLFQCAVAALKSGDDYPAGLSDLDRISGLDDQVHNIRIRLLKALPVRAPSKQLALLDRLLGQTLRYPNTAELSALVEKKLNAKSTTDGQRVRWLATGALLSPSRHRQSLRDFISDNDERSRHLAQFLSGASENDRFGPSVMGNCSEPAFLKNVIEMLGRLYAPLRVNGIVTLEIDASDRIASLISLLGAMPSNEAHAALTDLIENPSLTSWQDQLTWSRDRQRVALRDATYHHPSIEQVQRTLDNGPPANAADLAALVEERLREICQRLRGDSDNPWRHFWNEDSSDGSWTPKHEESCRDAVLFLLKGTLPHGIDAVPEGHYAAGTRADIRVSYGGHNIPIELKKDDHRDLWTALRAQLVGQYTTDRAADEHGIYVPLWFGLEDRKPPAPPHGHRPKTAAELQQQLERDLTAEEARKVSVLVLDVTKPLVGRQEA
ncbi:NACHT domain-containing protein [Candidatus Poriferisocius sp.]|uniref:NACHT domain-containing protein n=1 Tax=Candidatus Poriferisocius sp. TaxID=3101276 RepID=UPI003B028F79